jgi:hypothetical protein
MIPITASRPVTRTDLRAERSRFTRASLCAVAAELTQMAARAIDGHFWLLVIARVVGKLGLPRSCPRRGNRGALDATQRAQLFLHHDQTLLRWRL